MMRAAWRINLFHCSCLSACSRLIDGSHARHTRYHTKRQPEIQPLGGVNCLKSHHTNKVNRSICHSHFFLSFLPSTMAQHYPSASIPPDRRPIPKVWHRKLLCIMTRPLHSDPSQSAPPTTSTFPKTRTFSPCPRRHRPQPKVRQASSASPTWWS